ncbi:TetR/AcrR family transcriptional regulator [Mycolicibacterium fluoranthenivorans]|jgi:AcrR family transcriptional regulator|uniref:TetR/AcrR family transcriptional regulator n=1 Tax=Mycolicibacterium fluoranthenivorans TaxID=258505 RepID=A0A7G8PAK7_9MYCO|nr:TetR/AcrR family transcriptional regulator [Mycolicibacterium fluoranthenivorans]QNJ91373.1 TetR/AcrR family transcriptional regulator [Mycolicibacterium fluoranthenivorans]
MPRLTRAQRQEQTRAELVRAARRRFMVHGYAATSLDDVAEDAGYSKGAVYSNFGSKPNLCRAVLELIHREKFGEIAELAMADADLDSRIAAVNAWFEGTVGDVGWTMLELEFVVLSRNNPELTEMITALREEAAQSVAGVLRALSADLGIDESSSLAAGLDDLGNLLLSAGIGLGIQRAIDPSVPARPATEAIRYLVNMLGAVGSSTGATGSSR